MAHVCQFSPGFFKTSLWIYQEKLHHVFHNKTCVTPTAHWGHSCIMILDKMALGGQTTQKRRGNKEGGEAGGDLRRADTQPLYASRSRARAHNRTRKRFLHVTVYECLKAFFGHALVKRTDALSTFAFNTPPWRHHCRNGSITITFGKCPKVAKWACS